MRLLSNSSERGQPNGRGVSSTRKGMRTLAVDTHRVVANRRYRRHYVRTFTFIILLFCIISF